RIHPSRGQGVPCDGNYHDNGYTQPGVKRKSNGDTALLPGDTDRHPGVTSQEDHSWELAPTWTNVRFTACAGWRGRRSTASPRTRDRSSSSTPETSPSDSGTRQRSVSNPVRSLRCVSRTDGVGRRSA